MAKMKIYGTPTSPPTRVARVAAMEFGHEFEFCEMAWRVSSDELYDLNPAGRVPALDHDGTVIYDSRVIWVYLECLEDSKPHESLRSVSGPDCWREANAATMSYELLMTSMVIRGMEEEPPITEPPYLARCAERRLKLLRALDDMASDGWLVNPVTFGLADAVMICATDALVGREVIDIHDYPHLAGVRMRYQTRKSIAETLGEYYPGQKGGITPQAK